MLIMIVFINTVISFIVTVIVIKIIILFTLTKDTGDIWDKRHATHFYITSLDLTVAFLFVCFACSGDRDTHLIGQHSAQHLLLLLPHCIISSTYITPPEYCHVVSVWLFWFG